MGKKILPPKFFNQRTLKVAENLLGKFLVRKCSNREIAAMITEIEAYDGFDDRASHASRGKTKRNKTMFEKAGRWYVYFTYGMHWMLNIVCMPKKYPAAILIRGGIVDRSNGIFSRYRSLAQRARSLALRPHSLARLNYARLASEPRCENIPLLLLDGPAKLTKFLKINKKFNAKIANKKTGLWIEDRGIKINKSQIIKLKRVGIEYAGKIWANKPYRFLLRI